MFVLRLGLMLAGVAFLYAGWASWSAGYGPEIAVVRGLVAFIAVSLVGYVGELIVATAAPPSQRSESPSSADDLAGDAAATLDAIADDDGETVSQRPEVGELTPTARSRQQRRAA